MNIDFEVIILLMIVEGLLLGYLWSRVMVGRVIAKTARPRMAITGALLGFPVMFFLILLIVLLPSIFEANDSLELGSVPFIIGGIMYWINVGIITPFLSLLILMPTALAKAPAIGVIAVFIGILMIAALLYLGAALGVKIATTGPFKWLAFWAPVATVLVLLLALLDDAFSSIRHVFESLYLGAIETILSIFGHYVAIAFQVFILASVVVALFWLGKILSAKVATIKPSIMVIFGATIVGALVFYLGKPFAMWRTLVYIGSLIHGGFSLKGP